MPTQRFEGATLDEAFEAAVRQAGPDARIVGANRVRKGGLGGFFAREHVEIEVETQSASSGPARTPGASGRTSPPSSPALSPEAGTASDPLANLIEEMATSGPSSVLDLAEKVSTEEGHYAMRGPSAAPDIEAVLETFAALYAGPGTATGTGAARGAGKAGPHKVARTGPDEAPATGPDEAQDAAFAAVLARIARDAGLAPPDLEELSCGPGLAEGSPSGPAQHAATILTELGTGPTEPAPGVIGVAGGRSLGDTAMALRQLGLPTALCQSVMPAADRQSLHRELASVLRAGLPPLPSPPQEPTSVVVVIGPKGHVSALAQALAAQLGGGPDDVALATNRKVWRQQEQVISSPQAALEQRRSWRWRQRPIVVAVESEVRPMAGEWAAGVLGALAPTLCWGVASATHKPEDLAAWSAAVGGLDVVALVDLEATTTPAAALGGLVPIGLLDGEPATADRWADLLCRRLLG